MARSKDPTETINGADYADDQALYENTSAQTKFLLDILE